LICNKEDVSSLKFVESQLDYILSNYSLEKKKILLLCNQRTKSSIRAQNVNTEIIDNYLKRISDRYNVKIHVVNVNEVNIEDFVFQKFFNLMLINKNKENYNKIVKSSKRKVIRVNSSKELTECLADNPSENMRDNISETSCKLRNSKDCKIL
jgi:hypothetical protein